MANKRLKSMITIMWQAELEIAMIQFCIDGLTQSMNNTVKDEVISIPKMGTAHIQKKKQNTGALVEGMAGAGGILGMIVFVASVVNGATSPGDKVISLPFAFIIGGLIGCIVGAIVGGIIRCILGGIENREANEKLKVEKERIAREYKIAVKHYEENCKLKEKKEREIKRMHEALKQDIAKLEKHKKSLEADLTSFYEREGILEEYRHLIPMGYMYDLVRIEAADQLKGEKGLYYKAREDMKYDNVVQYLNTISQQLNSIIKQNNKLYSALKAASEQSYSLSKRIEKDADNYSKTIPRGAYNSEVEKYINQCSIRKSINMAKRDN